MPRNEAKQEIQDRIRAMGAADRAAGGVLDEVLKELDAMQEGIDNAGGGSREVVIEAGTTYTLSLADNGKVITFSNASPITLDIPGIEAGFNCTVIQGGGQITFNGTGFATILNADGHSKSQGLNARCDILFTTTNAVGLSGDTAL